MSANSGFLICLLAVAGVQCVADRSRPAADASTVTVLYGEDEWTLSPAASVFAQFLVFLPLVTYAGEGGESRPRLAERWEHSPDGRTWRFYLRKDVRWHDGTPVTAHDVKFTMDLWSHPVVHAEVGCPLESVTVLDDHTLEVVGREPGRCLLWGWPVFYPKHLLGGLDPEEFNRWEFWTHPVGNGPYRYVRHVPKIMMELEANPDYYRGKPRIERVILKFGGGSPVVELLSGNVDAAAIGLDDVLKLAEDPRFEVYHAPSPRRVQVYWNHRSELFRDPGVRRALTLAMDRRELHRALALPDNLPLTDGVYTIRQFRERRLPEPLPYDPDAAAELLTQAGWRVRGPDAARQRDGSRFRFTLIVPSDVPSEPMLLRAAILLQEQLSRVGIRMEVQRLENLVVRERLRAGEYEAAIHWTGSSVGAHAGFLGEGSATGYANPTVEELLEKAVASVELEERDRIFQELTEIVAADLPVTFLFPEVQSWAVHRRIRGLESPFRVDPIFYMEELWLEDEAYESR